MSENEAVPVSGRIEGEGVRLFDVAGAWNSTLEEDDEVWTALEPIVKRRLYRFVKAALASTPVSKSGGSEAVGTGVMREELLSWLDSWQGSIPADAARGIAFLATKYEAAPSSTPAPDCGGGCVKPAGHDGPCHAPIQPHESKYPTALPHEVRNPDGSRPAPSEGAEPDAWGVEVEGAIEELHHIRPKFPPEEGVRIVPLYRHAPEPSREAREADAWTTAGEIEEWRTGKRPWFRAWEYGNNSTSVPVYFGSPAPVSAPEAGEALSIATDALRRIEKHWPSWDDEKFNPEFDALRVQIDACEKCQEAKAKKWPPSGLCSTHYSKHADIMRRRQDDEEVRRWSVPKDIAREALARLASTPSEPSERLREAWDAGAAFGAGAEASEEFVSYVQSTEAFNRWFTTARSEAT